VTIQDLHTVVETDDNIATITLEELNEFSQDSEIETTIATLQGAIAGFEGAAMNYQAAEDIEVKQAFQLAADNAISVLGLESISVDNYPTIATEVAEGSPDGKILSFLKKAWSKIQALSKVVMKAVNKFLGMLPSAKKRILKKLSELESGDLKPGDYLIPDLTNDYRLVSGIGTLSFLLEEFIRKNKELPYEILNIYSEIAQTDPGTKELTELVLNKVVGDLVNLVPDGYEKAFVYPTFHTSSLVITDKLTKDSISLTVGATGPRISSMSSKIDVNIKPSKVKKLSEDDIRNLTTALRSAITGLHESDGTIVSTLKEVANRSFGEIVKNGQNSGMAVVQTNSRVEYTAAFIAETSIILERTVWGLFTKISSQVARMRAAEFAVLKEYANALLKGPLEDNPG